MDVRWIRLHYAYPRVFPDELIDVMATEPKIAKYLDMPLQHASDKLLLSMKRGRDSQFLTDLLAKLRERVPGLVMRTSLIVGLPGETEEDFELLKEFVKEQRFERLGVFQYSDEEGTAAFDMPDKVPQKTIERRWREIMAIQKRISREQNKKLVGQRIEVLVEGPSPETEHLLVGRHAGPGAGDRRAGLHQRRPRLPGRVRHRRGDRGARLRPRRPRGGAPGSEAAPAQDP